MINLKLGISLALLVSSIGIIAFLKQNHSFYKNLINKHIQIKGWGYADIGEEKDLDLYFGETNWYRPDWGFTEVLISGLAACILLLSGWCLTRYRILNERNVENIVEKCLEKYMEKLTAEFEEKFMKTLHSEVESLKANIKEDLSNLGKKQDDPPHVEHMPEKDKQDNLTWFKTSQVNYFPKNHQKHHVYEGNKRNFYESHENFPLKACTEPETDVRKLKRNIAGCDAIESCVSQIQIEKSEVKINNLDIGDVKANVSYTVVCPMIVKEDDFLKETPESPSQTTEISELSIHESDGNNENVSSTMYSLIGESKESKKPLGEVPESQSEVKTNNLDIGDVIKTKMSYTIVCPMTVKEDEFAEETPVSPCQINEISELSIDETHVNNVNVSSTMYSLIGESKESNMPLGEAPNSPNPTSKCSDRISFDQNCYQDEVSNNRIDRATVSSVENGNDNISLTKNNTDALHDNTSTAANNCNQENEAPHQTSADDAVSLTNLENESKSLGQNNSDINRENNKYADDAPPFYCPIDRNKGTNNVNCFSEDINMGPKEVASQDQSSKNPSRRIPQYHGPKKVSKKPNIERVGSVTKLSPSKAEPTISRIGTPRHQYSKSSYSSPRSGSAADLPVLSANNRHKQRNPSAK